MEERGGFNGEEDNEDSKRVPTGSNSRGGEVGSTDKDGKLVKTIKTQKNYIRQLENELENEKRRYNEFQTAVGLEAKKLKEYCEGQQKLVAMQRSVNKAVRDQSERLLQLESENVDLREKIVILQEQNRKLKICEKNPKDPEPEFELNASDLELERMEIGSTPEGIHEKCEELLGMLEYKIEDEPRILKALIYDLNPRDAISFLPGLPAYILFMCIRHADYKNDKYKANSLLKNTVAGIKKVVSEHDDLEMTTMWLANTCRLFYNLSQYSGENMFEAYNSKKQSEQCLKNLDLFQFGQLLTELIFEICQKVIKIMENKIQRLIEPAILKSNTESFTERSDPMEPPRSAHDCLIEELNAFYNALNLREVNPVVVSQIIRQILYFICARAFNNLLSRTDTKWHWSTGIQIHHNLSFLDRWCSSHNLRDQNVFEPLLLILQAAQLLQACQSKKLNVSGICDMCYKLSAAQVTKILNSYTPLYSGEERVPRTVIYEIETRLKEREEEGQSTALLMDTEFAYFIRLPFSPSNVQLEKITIPQQLSLTMLKKI